MNNLVGFAEISGNVLEQDRELLMRSLIEAVEQIGYVPSDAFLRIEFSVIKNDPSLSH